MSLYDWLLFLHVLAAFALVAAVVLLTHLLVAALRSGRPADVARTLRLVPVGEALWGVGAMGTLIFGIWLAIEVDGYRLWDGWIIAALVLWAIVGALAGSLSKERRRTRELARSLAADRPDEPSVELAESLGATRGIALHALVAVGTLLILLDMIWKPGA